MLTTLLILTLILLALNVYYFLHRSWEDSYYPSNYATLYYPSDRPVIRKWKEVSGGIEPELSWNAPVTGWKILKDGEPYCENSGAAPLFRNPGDTEMYQYTAIAQPEGLFPPLEFNIRFLPRQFHIDRGLPRPDSYIIRTDVPMGKFKQYPVQHWVDDYAYMDPDNLAEVDTILREKVGIGDSDSVWEKMEKLMVHLRDELGQQCRGTPPPDFRWKDPYQIYKEMRDGKGTGWCTQQGQMLVFLANRAGLSARLTVGARTQRNNFIFTGHTWLEIWIPEQGRWAWVDPSPALIYATNSSGKVLNTVEMAALRQLESWEGIKIRVYKDWQWPDLGGEPNTVVDATYSEVGDVVERQFITSAIYKWRQPPNVEDIRYEYGMLFKNRTFLWGNLVRYFFKPPLALANYPVEGKRIYWIRHLLLWGFLGSLAATVAAALF